MRHRPEQGVQERGAAGAAPRPRGDVQRPAAADLQLRRQVHRGDREAAHHQVVLRPRGRGRGLAEAAGLLRPRRRFRA